MDLKSVGGVCSEVGFRSWCTEVWSVCSDVGSVYNELVCVQLEVCPGGWSVCSEVVCSEIGVFPVKSVCVQLGIN